MTTLTKVIEKSYENYFPESILRSIHFWILTLLFSLTLANVVILLSHWSALPSQMRFFAVLLLLLVPQPWGFTIKEHRLLRRSGVADELQRKLAGSSLTSTAMAYLGLFVATDAMKLFIR